MRTVAVAMVSAANSGKREGRQWWPKQRQRKDRQQSTKNWLAAETAAAVAVAAAMATATMVATTLHPWQQ